MKANKIFILLALAASCAMGSCTLETSDNGDLDGYWHLEGADTLPEGGHADLSEERLFWSFQNKLLQFTDYKENGNGHFISRFEKSRDSLTLSDFYHYDREHGDSLIKTPDYVRPYGVSQIPERFHIERLKGDKMILKSKHLRLSLKKF